MFDEHMFLFVPQKVGISYKVRNVRRQAHHYKKTGLKNCFFIYEVSLSPARNKLKVKAHP